jgi:predicted transcriptional regulator
MVYAEYTMDTEMIEEKIGEVLGLEMAAQKAVDQLVSKGLLDKGRNNK